MEHNYFFSSANNLPGKSVKIEKIPELSSFHICMDFKKHNMFKKTIVYRRKRATEENLDLFIQLLCNYFTC